MTELMYPDYDSSILNLSCSILNHFGVKPKHKTLPIADYMLGKKHKHVVVILLDGLGMNILEQNLSYRDFLRRKLLVDYSSVFPPTTTASTTSMLSGLSPIEHGWLGWDVYFEQEDKAVTCFFNTLQGTNKDAADYDIPRKYLPYEDIITQINKAGVGKAYGVFPFGPEPHSDLHDWCNAIKKTCRSDEKTFTYAYWEYPDGLIHEKGTRSNDVTKLIRELNQTMLYLCEELKDTIVFITADHGLTNIRNLVLTKEYPELANMLIHQPCIEPRAASFYVKPEYMEEFPRKFNDYFDGKYLLMTKQEVLEKHIFGTGEPNPNLTGIGDFVALAVDDTTIVWDDVYPKYRGHHAGLTKDEMRIPLICNINRPKKTKWFIYYGIVLLIIGFIAMCLF